MGNTTLTLYKQLLGGNVTTLEPQGNLTASGDIAINNNNKSVADTLSQNLAAQLGAYGKDISISSDTWTTLATLTGKGCVTGIFLALGGYPPNDFKTRITFDGAATPQIGGVVGIGVDFLFGCRNAATTASTTQAGPFQKGIWGQSYNKGDSFGGYFNALMPFSVSAKIEVYGPACSGYAIIEAVQTIPAPLSLIPNPLGVRLYGHQVTCQVAGLAEQTLFDYAQPTILFGVVQDLYNGFDALYLEGPVKFYCSGNLTYGSSGTEDFYKGSFYWAAGVFQTDYFGALEATPNGLPTQATAYRFWPIPNAPADPNELEMTWTNGLSAQGNPGTTTLNLLRLFYAYTAPTPSGTVTPTGLTAAPGSTTVRLTWNGATNYDTAGYRLYGNGTLLTDIMSPESNPLSYTVTGLTTDTTYGFTISSYDWTNTETAQSSTVSATTGNVTVLNLQSPINGAIGGLPVTMWPDNSPYSASVTQSNASYAPTYDGTTPGVIFDGNTTFMATPDAPQLRLGTQFTIAAKIIWNGKTGYNCIIGKISQNNFSYKSWWFELSGNYSQKPVIFYAVGGSQTADSGNTANTAPVNGTPVIIAAVVNTSTPSIQYYNNGNTDGLTTPNLSGTPNANAAQVEVGSIFNGTSDLFGGEIIWVQVFDYALTQAEIQALT